MILKMGCKVKKEFTVIIQTMGKLLAVVIVTQEKINKIRDMMEMESSLSIGVKIWKEIFLWTLLNQWLT